MTARAVLVDERMADLAFEVSYVLFMLGISGRIGPDIFMAVFTTDGRGITVAVVRHNPASVELLPVTGGTGHGLLCPVDITRNTLVTTEILVANPGAMAGYAIVLHRRGLLEDVTGHQPTPHFIRTADVALTA